MNLKDELFLVTGALESAGIDYALCGGLAVVIHGYPRLTRDLDLLVREADLEPARKALEGAGFALSSGILTFDAGKPTERKLFRVTKAQGQDHLTVDMLLVNPFLREVWKGREQHLVEGKTLRVVSLEGLIKMKRAAGRPQDLADISQLEAKGKQ